MAVPAVAKIVVPALAVMLPPAAMPYFQEPEVPPVALMVPLLMTISPLLLRRAADLLVVAVTSALIVIVPSIVPMQVFVDLAFTLLLIVMPFFAPIATSDAVIFKGQLTVMSDTLIAYPPGLFSVKVLPPLIVKL